MSLICASRLKLKLHWIAWHTLLQSRRSHDSENIIKILKSISEFQLKVILPAHEARSNRILQMDQLRILPIILICFSIFFSFLLDRGGLLLAFLRVFALFFILLSLLFLSFGLIYVLERLLQTFRVVCRSHLQRFDLLILLVLAARRRC